GSLTFAQRGRGTGIWTSALFIGQFASPLIVLALAAATTGLSPALLVVGAAALLIALVAGIVHRVRWAAARA
ncbi:MFS transporter, partial [Amycolatopsis mediterranei]